MPGFGLCRTCEHRKSAEPDVCYRCFREATEPLDGVDVCRTCSHPFGDSGACENPYCSYYSAEREFYWNRSLGSYAGRLRRFVIEYKFDQGPNWRALILGRLLAQYILDNERTFQDFDLVIPSPTYIDADGRRTWDHIQLLADCTARHLSGWPIVADDRYLSKRRSTPSMVEEGKTWAKRREIAAQIRKSLEVPEPEAVFNARVLVIDDLFTGGHTLNEVARALRAAGAVRVCSLTVARRIFQAKPQTN